MFLNTLDYLPLLSMNIRLHLSLYDVLVMGLHHTLLDSSSISYTLTTRKIRSNSENLSRISQNITKIFTLENKDLVTESNSYALY